MLIVVGVWKVATGQAEPQTISVVGSSVPGVTFFLLLKAFSSGASSLTGVEAISNSVKSFKDPAPKNAVKTLIAMGSILGFMLVGMVYLLISMALCHKEKRLYYLNLRNKSLEKM